MSREFGSWPITWLSTPWLEEHGWLVGVFRAISRFEGKFERVEDGVSSDRSRNSFFFQEILFVEECWSFVFYVYVEGVVNLCWLICLVICTSF